MAACEDQGIELPQKIQNAPKLLLGLELYWDGFLRLSNSRASGLGLSGISWVAIEEYCDRIELFGDQRLIFHNHVEAMDKAFIEYKESHKDG